MLILVASAFAHPGTLPHLHDNDPVVAALLGVWILAGAAFLVVAHRRLHPRG